MTATDNVIHLESSILKSDYRSAVYFNLYGKRRYTLPLILLGVFVAVLRIFGNVFGFFPSNDLVFLVCVLYLVAIIGILITSEWQVSRFLPKGKETEGKQVTVEVKGEGITEQAPTTEQRLYHWRDIREVYELKEVFVIYVGEQNAILLAKRDCATEILRELRTTLALQMRDKFDRRG